MKIKQILYEVRGALSLPFKYISVLCSERVQYDVLIGSHLNLVWNFAAVCQYWP